MTQLEQLFADLAAFLGPLRSAVELHPDEAAKADRAIVTLRDTNPGDLLNDHFKQKHDELLATDAAEEETPTAPTESETAPEATVAPETAPTSPSAPEIAPVEPSAPVTDTPAPVTVTETVPVAPETAPEADAEPNATPTETAPQ